MGSIRYEMFKLFRLILTPKRSSQEALDDCTAKDSIPERF